MTENSGEPDLLAAITSAAEAFSGEFGCFAKNLITGQVIRYRADAVMPTASVIKSGALCEMYRQADAGLVDLGERRTVTPEDWWGGSGVLKEFAPDSPPRSPIWRG